MMKNITRRGFLGVTGGATASVVASTILPVAAQDELTSDLVNVAGPLSAKSRAKRAADIRKKAAKVQERLELTAHKNNGDEDRYPNRIANYSKCMPHNSLGEVDRDAYNTFLKAVMSGKPEDFEAIPIGGTLKFENPLAGLVYELQGHDTHYVELAPAPTFDSAQNASEMVELYWQALTRDVHFSDYETDPLTIAAAADLSKMSDFRGPKDGAVVTPATLFRHPAAGNLTGYYVSQFLLKDVPYPAQRFAQKNVTLVAGIDHMTNYDEWLSVQNGKVLGKDQFDPQRRYIRNGRDLSEFVHNDALFQAYYNALLILLGMRAARDAANPYLKFTKMQGFVTFGGPYIINMVARVATNALSAVWFHKWYVHRRLRPEAFAGRVHNHITKKASYPIHEDLLNSAAVEAVFAKYGNYLLPMAFPEGCPTHPAYGAGHSVVAAACTTILKCFFDESFVIPDPVVPNTDGTELLPYTGPQLTVGGELNKLAANMSLGRDTAGVHWRTDAALALGEEIAIAMLKEMRESGIYAESFAGFSLTKFDGTKVTV